MFIKLINNIRGSHAIETLIMVPVWLSVIVFCSYSLVISRARQSLANESMAFANIAAQSDSPDIAISKISSYVTQNSLDKKFYSSKENSFVWFTEDINGTKLIEGDAWSYTDTNIPYVYMWVEIHTAFTGVKSNTFKIGNEELTLFSETYTNRVLVVIEE